MRKGEVKQARARVKARQRRDKRRNRHLSRITVAVFFVMCIAVMFLVNRSSSNEKKDGERIILKVADAESVQGEGKPMFSASAVCEGDASRVLDEDSNYTVASLVEELNRGVGYTLECEEDGSREGVYAIQAVLTSEITTPLYAEWFGKVSIEVENGTFTVKNPYGQWENEKFQLWEGGYAKNQFITYRGKTYYLNEEGKKVTGEMKLGAATYTFDKKGELTSVEGGADPEKPMVALTFDDGPGPKTMELLGYLEKNQARATFFMLGQNVSRYEEEVKKMAEIDCELGNHSYNHPDLANLSAGEIKDQINKTNQKIMAITGQNATVVRPPYGSINNTVEENVGFPMILWSIDTLDWKTRDASKTIQNVMDNVQDGDIILMHDIHAESVDAAKDLIPKLQKAGYQLVTVSELAQARGITLTSGERYGRFRKSE